MTGRVAAVVVAFGDVPLLVDCVDALRESEGVDAHVVVVDNGASPEMLRKVEQVGVVDVVAAGGNIGFGAGCNLGARTSAPEELVAFVNPDVVVAPDALARLAVALDDDSVGIATASVRLLDDPELLNSAGGAIHFLGLGWAEAFRQPVAGAPGARDVMAASGATMMMRRELFDRLGGFTPELFLYHEDAELSFRCWIAGYRVRYVPEAVSCHSYDFARNPRKLYFLERNRLCLVLTCYERRTLALLAPALVAFEAGMVLLALVQGWITEKLAGWWWCVRHVGWLRAQRRRVQHDRQVADRELVPLFAARFSGGQVPMPGALRPADAALALYWRAVSRAL